MRNAEDYEDWGVQFLSFFNDFKSFWHQILCGDLLKKMEKFYPIFASDFQIKTRELFFIYLNKTISHEHIDPVINTVVSFENERWRWRWHIPMDFSGETLVEKTEQKLSQDSTIIMRERLITVFKYFNTVNFALIVPKALQLFDCIVSSPADIKNSRAAVDETKRITAIRAKQFWELMSEICKPTPEGRTSFVDGMVALSLNNHLVLQEFERNPKSIWSTDPKDDLISFNGNNRKVYTHDRIRGLIQNKKGLLAKAFDVQNKSGGSHKKSAGKNQREGRK